MAAGDATNARVRLAELREDGDVSVLPTLAADITEYAQLVRIVWDAGDDELAQSAVDAAEARCRRNPGVRSIAATAAHGAASSKETHRRSPMRQNCSPGDPVAWPTRRHWRTAALNWCAKATSRAPSMRSAAPCSSTRPPAQRGTRPSATAAARTGCATAPRQGGSSDDGMGGLDRRRSRRGTPRCGSVPASGRGARPGPHASAVPAPGGARSPQKFNLRHPCDRSAAALRSRRFPA